MISKPQLFTLYDSVTIESKSLLELESGHNKIHYYDRVSVNYNIYNRLRLNESSDYLCEMVNHNINEMV